MKWRMGVWVNKRHVVRMFTVRKYWTWVRESSVLIKTLNPVL